jgi:hypothetical protein
MILLLKQFIGIDKQGKEVSIGSVRFTFYMTLISYQRTDFIRFNGPMRSNDPDAIANDINVLRIMSNNSSNSINSRRNRMNNLLDAYDDKKVINKFKATSFLVDQLPNTISVSFRGIKTKDLMPLLADKVRCEP